MPGSVWSSTQAGGSCMACTVDTKVEEVKTTRKSTHAAFKGGVGGQKRGLRVPRDRSPHLGDTRLAMN